MNNNRILATFSVSSRSLFTTVLRSRWSCCLPLPLLLLPRHRARSKERLQVSGPVDLEVLTHSGDVTVRAGSSGSVFIRGKIYVGDHWLIGRPRRRRPRDRAESSDPAGGQQHSH